MNRCTPRTHRPLGHTQIAPLAAVQGIDPPAAATFALIQAESQNARYHDVNIYNLVTLDKENLIMTTTTDQQRLDQGHTKVQIPEGTSAEVDGVRITLAKVKYRSVDGGPRVPEACLVVTAIKPAASERDD